MNLNKILLQPRESSGGDGFLPPFNAFGENGVEFRNSPHPLYTKGIRKYRLKRGRYSNARHFLYTMDRALRVDIYEYEVNAP